MGKVAGVLLLVGLLLAGVPAAVSLAGFVRVAGGGAQPAGHGGGELL